jgi:hypothetical protein
MRTVRLTGASGLVLLGAMLIVAWALSLATLERIHDGSAVSYLTDGVLASPDLGEVAADAAVRAIDEQLDSTAGDVALALFEEQIRELAATVVESEAFQITLREASERVQDDLLLAVTDPDREPGPLVVSIDVGERVNASIDEIPFVGEFVPDLELQEVEVEIVPESTIEDLRASYRSLSFAATWFVWLGIALILGGIALAPRWRWFLPRSLVALAVLAGTVGLTLGALAPATAAALVPGGREGSLGAMVEGLLTDGALAPVTELFLVLALIALVGACVFVLIVRMLQHGTDAGNTPP